MAREERKRASARRRVETHDSGGGSKYIRLPEGYSFLQVKAGKYRLDFLSYEVKKGKGDDGGNPYFEKGELAFERTFFVHRDVGPNRDWHLCAAKTLGQPCPICEFRAKQARDPNADEEVLKELAPKERQLWIVKDLEDPDELHVMEYSYHLFGKQLDAKISASDEEDGYEFFADPVDGMTVRVNFAQSDRGKWVEATDIEFRPRRDKYDADIVEEQPDLDSLFIITPYDKLKRIFLQTEEEKEDDEEEKPAARKKSAPEEKEPVKKTKKISVASDIGLEEGDRVYYSGGVCEVRRISKDGTSLNLEDDDGELIKGIGVDEVKKIEPKPPKKKPVEEDEDEPAPKKKAPAKKKPEPVVEDDDEDEEEDEEEEEPAPKKKAPAKKSKPVDDDEEEDEDEDEPAAKKKAPAKKSKKDADDDNWDDWD